MLIRRELACSTLPFLPFCKESPASMSRTKERITLFKSIVSLDSRNTLLLYQIRAVFAERRICRQKAYWWLSNTPLVDTRDIRGVLWRTDSIYDREAECKARAAARVNCAGAGSWCVRMRSLYALEEGWDHVRSVLFPLRALATADCLIRSGLINVGICL